MKLVWVPELETDAVVDDWAEEETTEEEATVEEGGAELDVTREELVEGVVEVGVEEVTGHEEKRVEIGMTLVSRKGKGKRKKRSASNSSSWNEKDAVWWKLRREWERTTKG